MAGRSTIVKKSEGANKVQIGGSHYKTGGFEHWDMVKHFGLNYMQGNITKYVMRHDKKNGLEDLQKAQHYLDKYIEQCYGQELQEQRDKKALEAVMGSDAFVAPKLRRRTYTLPEDDQGIVRKVRGSGAVTLHPSQLPAKLRKRPTVAKRASR